MPDRFSILSVDKLLKWILEEEKTGTIFGISENLFFRSSPVDVFKLERYGKRLDTPMGAAAGPHTQLAQNIITAYLTGSRYIELKTIQTLDDLNISRPCIDMEDEGYNCEWSQELKLKESFEQYLNAFIIIHILNHKFGYGKDINCIFNMSAGYNMEGILRENVQDFISGMSDAKKEIDEKLNLIENIYPEVKNIEIPGTISDNITISTMHGCPPDEIESIARHFLEVKKLHTTVKLNPTLLGYQDLNDILNSKLGFGVVVPESAFEHDIAYDDALNLISLLRKSAESNNVGFSLKLTNTLECLNNKPVFAEKEKIIYMSGRALHPISIALAAKLQNDFEGELDISFSAGADCFNIADTLACGLAPVTICSDFLKPGGYARQAQYLGNIKKGFKDVHAESIDEFIINRNPVKTNNKNLAVLNNLNIYSEVLRNNPHYKKSFFTGGNIKTNRELTKFDCIKAPCVYTCPDSQDIPDYMYYTSMGDLENAFRVVLKSNPFPAVTGMICDQMCRTKCTRMNYDNPLLIREVKRYIAENSEEKNPVPERKNGKKITVIGAGPSGLSAAYFLALEGFEVEIYDSKSFAGGMVSDVIPGFRLSKEAIQKDIKRIENLGVRIIYNMKINDETLKNIIDNLDDNFLYIAVGAQKNKKLNIQGEDNSRVLDSLKFLSDVRRKSKIDIGKDVAIIGGGNSAIDAARTAKRVTGDNSNVTVIYRRRRNEMPADKEEINIMLKEGIELIELTVPDEIIDRKNKLKLICHKTKPGRKDEPGRAIPEKVEGSGFNLEFDTIITAIGQETASGFLKSLKTDIKTYKTNYENVYVGGDALRGASTLIKAIADGKSVAENIIHKTDNNISVFNESVNKEFSSRDFQIRNATRVFGEKIKEKSFINNCVDLLTEALSPESAQKEASRCLYCDTICNVCVTVCPDRANISYEVKPFEYSLKKIIVTGNNFGIKDDLNYGIYQNYQVLNIQDFCNECGNCTTFCPSKGAPYKDKPRLFLKRDDFLNDSGEGYFIYSEKGKKCIEYKHSGITEKMILLDSNYIYKNDNIEVKLNKSDLNILNVKILNNFSGEYELKNAADMSVLLNNIPGYLFLITDNI